MGGGVRHFWGQSLQVIPVDLDTATTQEKKSIARPTQREEVNGLPPVPPTAKMSRSFYIFSPFTVGRKIITV